MKHRSIYLDYAAATPMDKRVKREMVKYFDVFGNASSVHTAGREAKKVIDDAKQRIGRILNCRAEELVITGSGTEANNLAIFGIDSPLNVRGVKGGYIRQGHVVTTNIEHHSVLRPLQKRGNVTFVPVKPNGIVDPADVAKAIRPDTVLVSVIYANNEIGTIQPIKEISKTLHVTRYTNHVLLHIDACQAAGFLNLNVQELGVDLMTINGSKIYGPKGIGALFVRRGTRLEPQILGGDQERGLRAGTQNPWLIAGLAKALEIASANLPAGRQGEKLTKMRDWMIGELLKIPGVKLNGDAIQRLPNNINLSFKGDGEMLMLKLDLKGIAVSTGAACTVTSNEPSHVLRAISPQPPLTVRGGVRPRRTGAIGKGEVQEGNIRITLGRSTTKKELENTLKTLKHLLAE